MTNKEQILEERLKELNKILRKWSSKYGVEAANDVWEFLLVDLESLLSQTQQATIEEIEKGLPSFLLVRNRGLGIDVKVGIQKYLDKLKKEGWIG